MRVVRAREVFNPQMSDLTRAIEPSLSKASSKIWFDSETDRRAPAIDDGHVLNAIWDRNRLQPAVVHSALPELSPQQIEASLAKGMTVPVPKLLDIKGALVTAAGSEYVAESKRTGALQIHLMGWT
jgi:hypothetical protein